MKRKVYCILLLFSINLIAFGQNNYSGSFSNSNYIKSNIGKYSCDISIRLFKDSTFTYFEKHFHRDYRLDYYSSGKYLIEDDTIVLKSLENDPNVKVLDTYSIKHKNAGILMVLDNHWKDISGTRLFYDTKIMRVDTILGHFSFLLNSGSKKRKKISVDVEMPSNIMEYYSDSNLMVPKRFSVFQKYRETTHHLGHVDNNDSLYIWDLDSSIIVLKSNKFFTTDTVAYKKNEDNIHFELKYNNLNLPSAGKTKYKYYECIRLLPSKIGNTSKEDVLKKSNLSYKKCMKLLLRSDFFKNNRISFSDSLVISFNVVQLSRLMNSFGSHYISEILHNNLNLNVFLKSKTNPDFYVSKPAFTKDKVFAIVRVKKINCDNDKYYLFERRKHNYILIGKLTDKIEKVNTSMFIWI